MSDKIKNSLLISVISGFITVVVGVCLILIVEGQGSNTFHVCDIKIIPIVIGFFILVFSNYLTLCLNFKSSDFSNYPRMLDIYKKHRKTLITIMLFVYFLAIIAFNNRNDSFGIYIFASSFLIILYLILFYDNTRKQ